MWISDPVLNVLVGLRALLGDIARGIWEGIKWCFPIASTLGLMTLGVMYPMFALVMLGAIVLVGFLALAYLIGEEKRQKNAVE